MDKKKFLWVGDAGCPSGFAKGTHKLLESLHPEYDVTVLGINYRGDPHSYPYPLYAASAGGDYMGYGRLVWMCDLITQSEQDGPTRRILPQLEHRVPDLIVIQNDPWNFPPYLQALRSVPAYKNVPVIGIVAVDGVDCLGAMLNGLSMAVFWTDFGLKQARNGGYDGPAVTIPLGVDLDIYKPMDKLGARHRRGLPKVLDDAFIIGNVNRNQPRKRWDLTVKYFAEWVHNGPLKDAYLYMHVAPTGDMGIDVKRLAISYGVMRRMLLMEPETFYGVSEEDMRDTYNCFDVQITTTQGEGFGLTTFEGMACGVPQIVPDWAALGELCAGAARIIPCTSTAIGPPYVNVIGGIPDQALFTAALDELYADKNARAEVGAAGLARAREKRFRWENSGEALRLIAGLVERHAADQRAEREAQRLREMAEAAIVANGLGGGSSRPGAYVSSAIREMESCP